MAVNTMLNGAQVAQALPRNFECFALARWSFEFQVIKNEQEFLLPVLKAFQPEIYLLLE